MTLILELTPEQERELEAEARQRNIDTRTYALARLFGEEAAGQGAEEVWTGADLVAYWEREGVIGSRLDITDSLEHARAIRRKGASANDADPAACWMPIL